MRDSNRHETIALQTRCLTKASLGQQRWQSQLVLQRNLLSIAERLVHDMRDVGGLIFNAD